MTGVGVHEAEHTGALRSSWVEVDKLTREIDEIGKCYKIEKIKKKDGKSSQFVWRD